MPLLFRDRYYQGYKPIDDEVMGNILTSCRQVDFFDLATKGRSARDYRMGDGYGVVSITIGDVLPLLVRAVGFNQISQITQI